MKKIKKAQAPLKLEEYLKEHQNDNWEDDFKNNCQDGHKEVIAQIKKDQGGICCYCEIDFGSSEIRDDFRVEHFHPKSDSGQSKNWDLDWDNLFGCCHGGSDRYVLKESRYISNKRHRHSDVLKSEFIWDNEILNPLEIPAFPALFKVSYDGKMEVISENCPDDLLQKAKNSLDEKKLNLNSPKLKEWRQEVINKLRVEVNSIFELSGDMAQAISTVVESQLSKDSSGNYPRFFSTIRSYLQQDAEQYLRKVGFDG